MMPVILATKRFPRGAPAPREVWPDEDVAAFTPDAARKRLERVAPDVATRLYRSASERSSPRFTHAYFGMLTPYHTLRLLAAHTKHHERGLAYAVTPRD
jgi:hypothetical protein